MIRALAVIALLAAGALLIPGLMEQPLEAAPQVLMPGEPGEPGGDLGECPWLATIEIVDCDTGAVIGWRTKSISSQGQCSTAINELTLFAQNVHRECVGDSWCREYSWCED